MNENAIARQIVDAAFKIHYRFGPGLLELPYEIMMDRELVKRGLGVQRQVRIPLEYEGEIINDASRADMIVSEKVIVEIKAAEATHPVYRRQLHTYLKITGLKLGLFINFGTEKIKDGIVRIINGTIEYDDQ